MDQLQTQGISLPRLGLGTFRMQGNVCRAAVESALALGYRHIDTAEMYANEEAIGASMSSTAALRSASVKLATPIARVRPSSFSRIKVSNTAGRFIDRDGQWTR